MITEEDIANLKDIYWWLKGFVAAMSSVDKYLCVEDLHLRSLSEATVTLQRGLDKEKKDVKS